MRPGFTNDFKDIEPIMDSVYGIVKISPFEKRLISTKEMQRLRGIKQLGFVNLVYPDAEHSRFAHSIGVCHQAKKLMEHVSRNISNSEKRYQPWRTEFVKDKGNIPGTVTLTEIEKIVISAAALLHDLPHAPFSHEIENPKPDGSGIPVHDKYKENPAFFSYLFDKEKSDLAKVIEIYNDAFWQLVDKDDKWKEILKSDSDREIDDKGYVEKAIYEVGKNKNEESKGTRILPLLGVMIFEIMLFDKMELWLDLNEDKNKVTPREQGVEVAINDVDKIKWKPINKWFRPYRKDFVANTICADLLDYLLRDGKNTGIIPSLDLKFFDRMTIAKAIPDKTNALIPLREIPDFCEHVVFDIFDHKRGVIRQSVITEILSFLQQRYLLAERVYNHRVVEGARSMLQETSHLLVSSSNPKTKELHKKLHDTNSTEGTPISDETFLSWVLDIKANGEDKILKAQQLVKMIRQRRIFREVVIIDGILGLHKGTYRGNDVNCMTLADSLLDDENRGDILDKLTIELKNYCKKEKIGNIPDSGVEPLFTIGVRKFGKRYKIPRVLVAKPVTNNKKHDIETFPLFEGKELPAINDRLLSMQHAYKSLWKVYLFIHPFFHHQGRKNRNGKFELVELHKKISDVFINELYQITGIKWVNSIEEYEDLLPETAIDTPTFVKECSIKEPSEEEKQKFVSSILAMVNESISPEHSDFRLRNNNSLMKKFKKKVDEDFFRDSSVRETVMKDMKKYNPNLLIQQNEGNEKLKAATDKEELVFDNVVAEINKIVSTEKSRTGDGQEELPLK